MNDHTDDHNVFSGRSCSPCVSTNDEDTSEAFEDAHSELEKDPPVIPTNLKKYEAINEIKVASPLRRYDNASEVTDPSESVLLLKEKRSYSVAGCGSDFPSFDLPPLETFLKFGGLDLSEDICGSFAGSLENDLLPSTPLTDEQMRHADSVLNEEMAPGVPINRIEVEKPPIGKISKLRTTSK